MRANWKNIFHRHHAGFGGRTYPVEIEYLPRRVGLNGPGLEMAAEEFSRFVNGRRAGDVLVSCRAV